MKSTYAAFRRRIRTGAIIEAIGHYDPKASGPRTALKVGATGVWWQNDNLPRFWLSWPKASEIEMVSPDSVLLKFPDGKPMSTLTIVSEGAGPGHVAKQRQPYPDNLYPPIESENAHGIASKKSRYSHHPWIVWQAGGKSFAARATVQNLDTAIAAIGASGKMSLHVNGTGMNGRRELAEIWRANAATGQLH